MRITTSFALLCASLLPSVLTNLSAAEPASSSPDDVLAGHSYHGEAFNEGPRQAAYLMPGMGHVDFPATTENEQAERFILQGVAQLHGFWYYEAERSFRQAAVLDPECAICYWGMAMANSENRQRAEGFIAEASSRKQSASRREQLYIESMENFCKAEDSSGKEIDRKKRAQNYTLDLEEIVEEFPDDPEAKAFLAVQLWKNERAKLPIVSHVAIDALLQDVFDANPMHPAHHYRIHLWDRHKAKRALKSAALCGPSLPGIAHMWHMPGHIYSRLHRYHDAVWQQEASARVDHAHMMRDRVLPDQIHNFAHNNEWLIRNLLKVGRVDDALALAKNMLQLPRHPKYNTLKSGSTKYGRQRLLLTLSTYRLWPELIELSETMVLEPTEDPELQVERMRAMGVAYALNNQPNQATATAEKLAALLQETNDSIGQLDAKGKQEDHSAEEAPPKPAPASAELAATDDQESTQPAIDPKKAEANRKRRKKEREEKLKQLKRTKGRVEKAITTVEVAQAAAAGDWKTALEKWKKSELSDNCLKAEWLAADNQLEKSLKLIDKEIDDNPGEVLPLAVKAWIQYSTGNIEDAATAFEPLRVLASAADLHTPLLARLEPLASELEAGQDWAAAHQPADDIGSRPDLDTLGPFRWRPYLAPDFAVTRGDGRPVHLKHISQKPTLIIFYLGFGCLHCVEQLHEFSPRAEQFRQSGIDIMAISTEDVESLTKALDSYSKPLDIPLHADPELAAFKAYRCFDDFEQQPLHGTFLVAPDGHVLWQDISYEPFMDVDFALEESHRLLRLAGFAESLRSPVPQKFTSAAK